MKQILQDARTGTIVVEEVPAPKLLPGCALVRIAASVVSARKETIRSRWRQDKGHRAEWMAFAEAVQKGSKPPIRFDDLICSTLTMFRI